MITAKRWLQFCLIFSLLFETQSVGVADTSANYYEPLVRVKIENKIVRLPLEQYLMGVLPNEMPASWHLEALKAQVVASRSFVLSQIEARRGFSYDVESTIMDQVFRLEHSQYKGPFEQRVKRALNETRGIVIFEPSSSKRIQRAYFHSDCGGSTETSFYVWRTKEPLMQVKDERCPLGKHSSWSMQVSLRDLAEQLGLPEIKKIEIANKTPSGRVGLLKVTLKDGRTEMLLSESVRKALGFNQLKSTMFTFKVKNGEVHFSGKGHGHGVGMCQWGARSLADAGSDFKKILQHYFPLSRIEDRRLMSEELVALSN